MALIQDFDRASQPTISFVKIAGDVAKYDLHYYMWSDSTTHYVGYINSAGHAVVYKSTSDGRTWIFHRDFGGADGILLNQGLAAVWAGSEAGIFSISSGSRLRHGTTGGITTRYGSTFNNIVRLFPTQLGWDFITIQGFYDTQTFGSNASFWSLQNPITCAAVPFFYGCFETTAGGQVFTTNANYDSSLGRGGYLAAWIGNPRIEGQNPSVPGSPLVLKFDTYYYNLNTPGTSTVFSTDINSFGGPSRLEEGQHTYQGFGGCFIQPGSFNYSSNFFNTTRPTWNPGWGQLGRGGSYQVVGPIEVCDLGIARQASCVAVANVQNRPTAFWVTGTGLLASTWRGANKDLTPDGEGTVSPWGKAKVYGRPNLTVQGASAHAVSQPRTNALIVTMVASYNEMWCFRDSQPHVKATSARVKFLSQVKPDPPLDFAKPVRLGPGPSTPLGPIRTKDALPAYDLDRLVRGCTDPNSLPNPNRSKGCSPVLRELFYESGIPFSIIRETANDGENYGHQGGNALDICGPDMPDVLSQILTDVQNQEMVYILDLLRAVPELFATAVHVDLDNASNSVFIYNGSLTTIAKFGGATGSAVRDYVQKIHISSSPQRLLSALNKERVQAALGIVAIAPGSAPGSGLTTPTRPFQIGQFGNRRVWVNPEILLSEKNYPLDQMHAESDPALRVNFW